jgi:hypothetical protein
MNADTAMDFSRAWLSAWTGNEPENLIEFYADDAFYLDPARPMGLNGRESILAYFRKLLAANPRWKWEALEVFPTERGFTLKWKATIPVGPDTLMEYGLDIVELHHGKIVRNEVYFNLANLLSARQGP